jgi:5-hydroxyisourate hydrolase-like protein (transthyretin family)
MRSLSRCAIASILILCCAGFLPRAQAQTKTTRKGSVAGKVTVKGKPAPGVVVGLRAGDPGSPFEPSFKATTDQDGRYRLNDIPAGSYQVAPAAAAFVISDANNSRGQTVVLGEGENVDEIDFALVRGGVITGKVSDADGRPVIEQRVNLLAAEQPANQRGAVYPLSSVQTDDRGIYRMFGVTAGRYKIAVGLGPDTFFMGVGAGRPAYKQTFHPDTTDPAKATVIEVSEGSEATNVDISLGRPTQTFAASGHVIDGESGQPIANVRFGLQLLVGESRSFVGASAMSNAQGEFRLENLAPGKYGLFILPQRESDARADAVGFDIIDQDVSGLEVRTSKGSSLSGTVVIENTDDKAVWAKLMQLYVNGYVQSEGPSGGIGHSATINSDGSFLLNGLETGNAFISLGSNRDASLLKGFSVARIERDGVVQQGGIEIRNGDQITGVRLVVDYGNGTVRGVVKLENGTLPADARIYVQVTKTGERNSGIRPPQVDARGHFIVQGLAQGLYNFTVTVFSPATAGAPRPRAKQQVNISDGVVTDVTITLDLSQKPEP